MVAGRFDEEEIWPDLRDAEAGSVHKQAHPHARGVSTAGTGDLHDAQH